MEKLNENLAKIPNLTYDGKPIEEKPIPNLPADVVVDGYKVHIDENGKATAKKTEVTPPPEEPEKEDTSGANHPVLKDGMKAVTYDEDGNSVEVPENKVSGKTWYSYEVANDGDLAHGGTDKWNEETKEWGSSHWANATLDGNYYVWIPRYCYKIYDNPEEEGYEEYITQEEGKSYRIDVKFLSETSNQAPEGYIVHPAFTFGEQPLEGIWVGKYETTGNETTPTILPNQKSLTDINVATMFNTAQKLGKENIDAHILKNIEWGAVSYLTQSQYGRNGTEVSVNQCKDKYTGAGRGIGADTDNSIWNSQYSIEESTNLPPQDQQYNGKIGKLSSTTGNIYGIYDMSGGAFEYVMGFYGTAKDTPSYTGFSETPNRKYYDLYLKTTADESNIGDALYETKGWNSDNSIFVYSESPVFRRGGNYDGTDYGGTFYFSYSDGGAYSDGGFRVCLAVSNV